MTIVNELQIHNDLSPVTHAIVLIHPKPRNKSGSHGEYLQSECGSSHVLTPSLCEAIGIDYTRRIYKR